MEQFLTTHWSIVLTARDRATPDAQGALAALCTAYWYPLYAFVRRRGHDPQRAANLAQEFSARRRTVSRSRVTSTRSSSVGVVPSS
jgi:hypothetical protein